MKKTLILGAASLGIGLLILSAGILDLNNLYNYGNQPIPSYINKDNTPTNNQIDDKIATLGRVLFYDKNLSLNNTIACASCHKQAFAFGDTAVLSVGFEEGLTGRHSMRLVHSRFGTEAKFFWDERAANLETQTTMPIQDHVEMGFSGTNGQPNFDSLVNKLSAIPYYNALFNFSFGSSQITEFRIQRALAQFIRSMQSFDSKFDIGRAQAVNLNENFTNFTPQENQGKAIFLAPPPNGAGCQGCHRAPEFDIDPNSLNNGVIGIAGMPGIDLFNTRAPSLRNLFNPEGTLNGPLMHNGIFTTIDQVINHYNLIPQNPQNTNLDPRLQGPGGNLQLTQMERESLIAFLKTLTSTAIYTDERWSNPFDDQDNLELTGIVGLTHFEQNQKEVSVYPNPSDATISVDLKQGKYEILVFDNLGKLQIKYWSNEVRNLNISNLAQGTYILRIQDQTNDNMFYARFIKK
jgi:cytochrome c peroxidase